MWELAARGSRALNLRELALPFMDDVQAAVHQHTTLAVLDHGTVLYVERLSSPDSSLDAAHIAQRMPIHAASSGPGAAGLLAAGFQDRGARRPAGAGDRRRPSPTRPSSGSTWPRSGSAATWRLPGIGVTGMDRHRRARLRPGNTIAAALNAIVPRQEAAVPLTVPALLTAAHGISRALKSAGAATP